MYDPVVESTQGTQDPLLGTGWTTDHPEVAAMDGDSAFNAAAYSNAVSTYQDGPTERPWRSTEEYNVNAARIDIGSRLNDIILYLALTLHAQESPSLIYELVIQPKAETVITQNGVPTISAISAISLVAGSNFRKRSAKRSRTTQPLLQPPAICHECQNRSTLCLSFVSSRPHLVFVSGRVGWSFGRPDPTPGTHPNPRPRVPGTRVCRVPGFLQSGHARVQAGLTIIILISRVIKKKLYKAFICEDVLARPITETHQSLDSGRAKSITKMGD
ncbi:hypothetical protein EV361DRAFT_868924 [Lentinula raphanica]|nr:hypothetical protein EV361DRAFT_868924 [Lentinula raphanica]